MTEPPVGIEYLIGSTLRDVVEKWTITDVPEDDPSRAAVVILGKATSERSNEGAVISITTDHPLGQSEDRDGSAEGTPKARNERPWSFPAEIGTRFEKITGVVQIFYREGRDATNALKMLSAVTMRVKNAINSDPDLRSLKDDFGNFLIVIKTADNFGYQGGGGNTTTAIRYINWIAFIKSTATRF
jgi:hypothetical protein